MGLDELFARQTASSIEEFAIVMHNRLRHMAPARTRQGSVLGRLLNTLTFQNPAFVELDGFELATLLKLTGETADVPVTPSLRAIYLVPYEAVERLQAQIAAQAEGVSD